MGMLEGIFCACDNARVADETEERLVGEAEAARERLLAAADEAFALQLEAYFDREAVTEGYVERAYFYDGFRAAMRLMCECGIKIAAEQ